VEKTYANRKKRVTYLWASFYRHPIRSRNARYEMEIPPSGLCSKAQRTTWTVRRQSDLAAIENYARHFGLEQEGLVFAYKQAGLPPPTEEQKQVAERGLPLRPEQPAKKPPPSNQGGFYLGETSQ
jgi:hypothetical protein